MKLQIYCVMCGKEREISIPTEPFYFGLTVRKIVERYGWIVQYNGDHADCYCSKKCAE